MSTSAAPPTQGGSHDAVGHGSDKGPLQSLNLGFLKTLTEKRTTRDGQPPKRRGPKPDSKPALTRRQELNRQAQRFVRRIFLGMMSPFLARPSFWPFPPRN